MTTYLFLNTLKKKNGLVNKVKYFKYLVVCNQRTFSDENNILISEKQIRFCSKISNAGWFLMEQNDGRIQLCHNKNRCLDRKLFWPSWQGLFNT